ncbi:hypothetical protein WA158_006268 [Blastocystis sp. Blastoise]
MFCTFSAERISYFEDLVKHIGENILLYLDVCEFNLDTLLTFCFPYINEEDLYNMALYSKKNVRIHVIRRISKLDLQSIYTFFSEYNFVVLQLFLDRDEDLFNECLNMLTTILPLLSLTLLNDFISQLINKLSNSSESILVIHFIQILKTIIISYPYFLKPNYISLLLDYSEINELSTRFIIFNRNGEAVSTYQMEHEQIYPHQGWVEHDPIVIIQNVRTCIIEALKLANLNASDLKAVGIANQRETIVIWNKKTGLPLYNAVVWMDARAESIITELKGKVDEEMIRSKTGLSFGSYFSGPKICWLAKNIPGIREAMDKNEVLIGTIDSWVIWNLTGGINGGVHKTDVTNASRTMLLNIHTLQWDDELLNIFNIPKSCLPLVCPSSSSFGICKGELEGVSIASSLGDQQAALFGQTCFLPGEAKNTYGTGCFLLMNTGERCVQSKYGLISTIAYQIKDGPVIYALEGSVAIAGALVQWLRDNLNIIQSSSEVEECAKRVTDSGGMYIVPAFSGLYAPYWREDARGVMVGLTRYIQRNHICRAALESTAYQTFDMFESIYKDSGVKLSALKVDGGMTVNSLLMQFQADILNTTIIRSLVTETTALGAAFAAGLTVGVYKNTEEIATLWKEGSKWEPSMEKEKRDQCIHGWQKAIERTLNWIE